MALNVSASFVLEDQEMKIIIATAHKLLKMQNTKENIIDYSNVLPCTWPQSLTS